MGSERRKKQKIKRKDIKLWKIIICGLGGLLLAFFVGGFLEQLFVEVEVQLNPFTCIYHGIATAAGRKGSIAALFLFVIVAGLIMWRGKGRGTYDERNFEISDLGTYGTAGFMEKEEQEQVLL